MTVKARETENDRPLAQETPPAGLTMAKEGLSAQRKGVVTVKDVAKAVGVSQSTVSRILNDTPTRIPISQDTRERIIAIAGGP